MAEDTGTETVDETAETEDAEPDLDKVRQQIQQELANRDKAVEGLSSKVDSLVEKLDLIASSATKPADAAKAEELASELDDVADDDLVEGKTLARVIRGFEKRIETLSKSATLPEADAALLEKVRQKEAAADAWVKDKTAFDTRWREQSKVLEKYDELTDAALAEVNEDELPISHMDGIRHRMAKDIVNGSKSGTSKKPRSTQGTQITKATATSSGKSKPEGDGVERDSHGLPVRLFQSDSG
jgi:hypothetical protein